MSQIDILSLPMGPNDIDAKTIGDYLKGLLFQLWEREEGFSGKRPFGNSGWKLDVYAALVNGGAVAGTLDEDGYVHEVDSEKADKLISDAIMTLCWTV